jgi:hypothetical protein
MFKMLEKFTASNDNYVADNNIPAIALDAVNAPANIVVTNTTPAAPVTPFVQLQTMESARINWEQNELAASNNRLYSILKQAYTFYLIMKTDTDKKVREERKTALDKFIDERGYVFTPSSHDMTRVVKCVFGVDRRRVSAYSIALREALRQEIGKDDLIDFIKQNGGVEQIRMGGTKPLSTTSKAKLGKDKLGGNVVGKVKFDSKTYSADTDWVDCSVVMLATYLPSGEFEVSAIIKHEGAVNAALSSYYSQQQAAIRAAEKADRDAEKAAAMELAKQEEAKKEKEKAEAEEKKNKKRAEKAEAEAAEKVRAEANKAHADTLFIESAA